jgi:SAM-dependent methyltransferase
VCLLEGEEMQSKWQVEFFRGVALDMWRRAVSAEQTRTEADFLERVLARGAHARLLDVPCGNGRHVVELAGRGHRMTGVDLSEEFIVEARGSSSLPIEWVEGDMCELPWTSVFDGAYCFGNSFGYLDSEGVRRFFAAVAGALKPGGRFAIETGMAAESILQGLLQKRWYRLGDLFMLSENQYHPAEGRLDIQYTFIRDSVVDTRPTSSYVFTVAEICRMAAGAGFRTVELLGSTEGEPYRLGSPRLILVLELGSECKP